MNTKYIHIEIGVTIYILLSFFMYPYACFLNSLSKFRPAAHVVCFAKSSKQARLLQIHYGLVPTISALQELPYEARVDAAVEQSKAMGLCSVGDRIIVVEGRRKSVMTGSGYGIHVVSVV